MPNTPQNKAARPARTVRHAKTPQTAARRLNDRQRKFCFEYLVDLNATRAAIRAGYAAKSAETTAHWLLGNPKIQEHLALLRNASMVETSVTPQRVIAELAKIAFADARDFLDEDGNVKLPAEWSDTAAAAIVGLDVVQDPKSGACIRKVKRADKTKALELLGRYLALFKDKVELSTDDSLRALLSAIPARRDDKEASP